MSEEQTVQVLEIKMTPAGVNFVLTALGKMPYEQIAGLYQEILAQANDQLKKFQELAKQSLGQQEDGIPSEQQEAV